MLKRHCLGFNASISCRGKIRVQIYRRMLDAHSCKGLHALLHTPQIYHQVTDVPSLQNSTKSQIFARVSFSPCKRDTENEITFAHAHVPLKHLAVHVLCVHANESSLQHKCSLSRTDSSCQTRVCDGGEVWDCVR